MQDDESNTNVNEEVVADEPQAPVEQAETEESQGETTEEVESNEPEETEQSLEEKPGETLQEEDEPVPGDEQLSRRAKKRAGQLRIQELLRKNSPLTDRPAPSQRTDALDYQQALDADPEVIKQLEADRNATGQAQYNEGLKRAEYLNWNTSLKIDAPQVEGKYPALNPKSPEFHAGVADSINQWYLQMTGFDERTQTVSNPNIGYAEFVEGFMELVQETAGQKNAQTVKNVAKQAATTGLRPDGSSAKRMNLNKDPSEMSLEELYASIGQKPPKK